MYRIVDGCWGLWAGTQTPGQMLEGLLAFVLT